MILLASLVERSNIVKKIKSQSEEMEMLVLSYNTSILKVVEFKNNN